MYEKKLITYPRTDSRFLTEDMTATALDVIEAVRNKMPFVNGEIQETNVSRILDNRKVTDHHAIIPTVEITLMDLAAVPETERKLLSLVATRLVCAVGKTHLYESIKAELHCEGYPFFLSGKTILEQGWKICEQVFRAQFNLAEDKENTEAKVPELTEGMCLGNVEAKVSKHYTSPPKRFTEGSLLLAIEQAGCEELNQDVERKGLGTPATRADIIEKLVKDGYIKREKKLLMPTAEGIKLITVLPEAIKSPSLTVEWENTLTLVAKGEKDEAEFMAEIHAFVSELVQTYHRIRDEPKKILVAGQESLGKCPNCGSDVRTGKFGAYCTGKCGMNVGRAMGIILTEQQVRNMLSGKRILLKGLKGKLGKTYDAYLTPDGIESYSYVRDGKETLGVQYKLKMEFPEKEN